MHVEYSSQWSGHLNREMRFNRYGHAGKPIIVFPSSGGSHNEYADFGMIEACQWFIDQGLVQFYTPDSVDNESWLCEWKSPYDRAHMHERYDRYIIDELMPHIKYQTSYQGPMLATGCSMGGYHSLNFYLRHPDVFDSVIALSGLYDVRYFFGDYHDRNAYENSPIDYLWNLNDGWFLDKYRSGNIIVATGQGNWEEVSIKDTKKIEEALRFKSIPAWIDFWGENVHHDWEWWRVQMPYFLGKLNEQGKLN